MKRNKDVNIPWQYKIVEYLVYFLTFFVPLYVDGSHWFPNGTPKTLTIIGATLVMVALLAWGSISESRVGNTKYDFSWLHGAFLLYFSALTISALGGVNVANSFFGRYEQSLSLVFLYSLGILACIVGFLAKSRKNFLYNVITVSFVTSVVVAIGAYFSTNSTLGNDSYVGAYLLFNFCFGIGLLFYFSKIWARVLAGLGIIIIGFSPIFFNFKIFQGIVPLSSVFHNPLLLLGTAMGATLGLVIALLVILFAWMFRSENKSIKILGATLFVTLCLSVFFVGYEFITPGTQIHNVYVAEKTGSRFLFWDIANSGFAERPVLGYGYGNYSNIYQKYFKPEIMGSGYTQEPWIFQPHNVIWEYLSTTGLVGTLAFFILLFYLFYVFYRRYANETEDKKDIFPIVFFGIIVGYFLQNLFIFDTPVTYFMFFLVIGLGISYAPIAYSFDFDHILVKKVIAYVSMIVCLICFLYLVVLPWQESMHWKELLDATNVVKIPEIAKGIQETSVMGDIEDTAYLYDKFFALIEKSISQITPKEKDYVLSAIDVFVGNLDKELSLNPDNFRAELVAGKMLNLHMIVLGKADQETITKASAHLESARIINPYSPFVYLALAQTHFIEHDLIGARMYTRASIAISPEYKSSYDFAENLDHLYPDKNFEDYLKMMTNRWSPKDKENK